MSEAQATETENSFRGNEDPPKIFLASLGSSSHRLRHSCHIIRCVEEAIVEQVYNEWYDRMSRIMMLLSMRKGATIDAPAAATWQRHRRRVVAISSAITTRRTKTTTTKTKTTVYALGEGWTGALGTGRLDQIIAGHHDDDEEEEYDSHAKVPVPMLETTDRVVSCDVGWGHTALIVQKQQTHDNDYTNNNNVGSNNHNHHYDDGTTQLLMTGRPFEISSLFRLRRLPMWFRQFAAKRTHQTANESFTLYSPVDIIGQVVTSFSQLFLSDQEDWEAAREQCYLLELTPIPLKIGDSDDSDSSSSAATAIGPGPTPLLLPITAQQQQQQQRVVCSAGWTAIQMHNSVYTFGLNGMGQCGLGYTSNNVWKPSRVTGLTTALASGKRQELEQTYPIVQTALGLQHGLCLNTNGELFSWGKGDRGQLGSDSVEAEVHSAVPVQKAIVRVRDDDTGKPILDRLGKVSQIACGLIHSAALEEDSNRMFIWGKNTLPPLPVDVKKKKVASDAHLPRLVHGLPENEKVLQITCGSHHTSMLLSDGSVWALGIATDTRRPIQTPVCLIPAGTLDLPVMQFAAHMDRTTVIDCNQQILQVHLWEDEENQEHAVFTPFWVDRLLDEQPDVRIREIHRGWLHTVVVTERDGQ